MKNYVITINYKEWNNTTGWTGLNDGLESFTADKSYVEAMKNGTVDWDDILKFSDMDRDEIEATAEAENDNEWTLTAYAEDDTDYENPVATCSAWESDLAKEWLAD